MRAFIKTLFGDIRNIGGVALIVAVAVIPTDLGHPAWAVYLMPAAGLCVVGWLALH